MKTLLDKIESGVTSLAGGVGKCVNYVVNDLGQDTKKLAVYGVVGAALLTGGVRNAEATTLTGFKDLVGDAGGFQYVQNYLDIPSKTGENLMIRDSNGIANLVSKNGTDVWRIGFAKDYDGTIKFGGYANNDNNPSNSYPGTLGGWCQGRFYNHVFADGESADDVMIIHDQLGDGIGTLDGGAWTLGADDVVYWTEDIEFNGVQGGISELGPFNYGEMKILPQMTIDQIPEPATVALLGLGTAALAIGRRKRK
ncbi:MAG: PEP-CTERM sorting domain-containing protein [Nanoarchaeota archaeon]|nr:PEP-CTERM sorting domain-containing protein [Nanoarchaeota archaeon]